MHLLLTQPRTRSGDGEADLAAVLPLIEASDLIPSGESLLVLPELIGGEVSRARYLAGVRRIARGLGVYVVGGSHLCGARGAPLNRGVIVGPDGAELAEYEKANRYGSELRDGFRAGCGGCHVRIASVSVYVAICADFWHLGRAFLEAVPDVVAVPAFSVTQKATPHLARARWRHQMIAKAYELTAFVGVSDWAPSVRHADGRSSGAAAFARPNPAHVRDLFSGLGARTMAGFEIDPGQIAALREDRRRRGFMAPAG
jgi:predicted amidohydrolase